MLLEAGVAQGPLRPLLGADGGDGGGDFAGDGIFQLVERDLLAGQGRTVGGADAGERAAVKDDPAEVKAERKLGVPAWR